MRSKVVDAAEAVAIIRSGDTVASSGFVGVGTPDEIIKALERRFVATGEPRDLIGQDRTAEAFIGIEIEIGVYQNFIDLRRQTRHHLYNHRFPAQ